MPEFSNKNRIGLLILLIPVAVVTAVIVSFVYNRMYSDNIKKETVSIDSEATLSIGKVHQVSTKDGVKQWSLKADSSQYYREKSEVVFNVLEVTFFSKNKKEYYLTADHGILNTDTNNMEASGNVIVVDEEKRRINAEKLHYDKNKHILYSNLPVELYDNTSAIKANSMKIELNQNSMLFDGNVEGIFSEKIKIN